MAKVGSPCIGVCKFKRSGPAGEHCIGCSMTTDQKKIAKKLKKPSAMAAFIALIVAQQSAMGRYSHWRPTYLKKAMRKGRKIPAILRRAS